jgi:pilus assembly protein CpaC
MIQVMRRGRWDILCWIVALLVVAQPSSAQVIGGEGVITLPRGSSIVLTQPTPVQRLAIGDPNVADAVAISPREILLTGKAVGTTSLIIWDGAGARRVLPVEVGIDPSALERQLRALFPNERIAVTASGSTVILSGRVSTGVIARRSLDLARGGGATVIDNLTAPPAAQVLLQVRFAEISRSASRVFELQARGSDLQDLGPARDLKWLLENTLGQLTRLSILDNDGATLEAALTALKTNGLLQILAEPNLLALDGEQASFLAGGEFPYPIAQATGGTAGTYTVAFKEFGVRLNFRPQLTGSGNIRLQVAPEVSQLDFGNSVQISGFTVPALRTRRAQTAVELRPGQTLAIAGLLDNSLSRNVERVPLLGNVPVLGLLFRSTNFRQNRSELVVLVTPVLVEPSDQPIAVPTGEPDTWRWDSSLRRPLAPPPAAPRRQP